MITFINPYIGIFFGFTVVEAIILGCLSINIRVRKDAEGKITKASLSALKTVGIFLPIFFLIVTSIVNLGTFVLGYVDNKIALPFNLFSNSKEYCLVLFAVTIILNIIKAICYMGKVKEE